MHLEFHPADAPDPHDPDVRFGVPAAQIAAELLALCSEFFGQASPVVHAELDQFLTAHDHYVRSRLVPRCPRLLPSPRWARRNTLTISMVEAVCASIREHGLELGLRAGRLP